MSIASDLILTSIISPRDEYILMKIEALAIILYDVLLDILPPVNCIADHK